MSEKREEPVIRMNGWMPWAWTLGLGPNRHILGSC
jgi:hypothetical protein